MPKRNEQLDSEAHEFLEEFRDLMYMKAHQGLLSTAKGQTYFWGAFQYVMWSRHAEGGDRNPQNFRQWLDFLMDQGHDITTVNKWLTGVKEFYRWAGQEKHYLDYDPTAGIEADWHTERFGWQVGDLTRLDTPKPGEKSILDLLIERGFDLEKFVREDEEEPPDAGE